jgi:2-oxoisovalerate dehydrogenase E2 component (dihydrolipoyl transacylase)
LRQDLKKQATLKGVKVSYMPIIIKATSLALKQFPMLNASVNADVTEVTHHVNHNIGVAVDTQKGLIVAVIKEVQNKSIFEIAAALNQLQDAATKGTITEAQLSGGTFTLSNIGISILVFFPFFLFLTVLM